MDRMRLRAASQLARLPVMTMVSELLFSAGRSILVLLSSRIYEERQREQRLPMKHSGSPGREASPILRNLKPEWHRTGGRGRQDKKSHDLGASWLVTFLMLAPPFPMMFLWNCLKIGTEIE